MNSSFYESVALNIKKSSGNTTLLAHVFEPVQMPKKLKVLGSKFSHFEYSEVLRINEFFDNSDYTTAYLTCASSMLYQILAEKIKIPTLDKTSATSEFMCLKLVNLKLIGEFDFNTHRVLYLSLNMLKIGLNQDIVLGEEVLTYLKENFSELIEFTEISSENIFFKKFPLKFIESKLAYLSPVKQKEYAFDIGPIMQYRSYMSEESVKSDSMFDSLQDHIIQQQIRLVFLNIFSPLFEHYNFSFDKRNARSFFEKGSGNFIFKVLIPKTPLKEDVPVSISHLFWLLIDYGILFSPDTLSSVINFKPEEGELKPTNDLLQSILAQKPFLDRGEKNTELGYSELYTLITALTDDRFKGLIQQIDDCVNGKKWKELALILEQNF